MCCRFSRYRFRTVLQTGEIKKTPGGVRSRNLSWQNPYAELQCRREDPRLPPPLVRERLLPRELLDSLLWL
jgi:hypothetical protein